MISNLKKLDWSSSFFYKCHQDSWRRFVWFDKDILASYRFTKVIDLESNMRHALHEIW
jgi:hypothetical protein